MAKVTGLTAERMLDLSSDNIISGEVNEYGHLILITRAGETINAGPIADLTSIINSIANLKPRTTQLEIDTQELKNAAADLESRVAPLENPLFSDRKAGSVQTLPPGDYHAIQFSQAGSTDIPWDSSNHEFVIPVSGLYLVTGAIYMQGLTGGRRYLRPRINDSYTTEWVELFPSQANTLTLAWNGINKLNAGDRYGISAQHTASGDLDTVVNSAAVSWIRIVKL